MDEGSRDELDGIPTLRGSFLAVPVFFSAYLGILLSGLGAH